MIYYQVSDWTDAYSNARHIVGSEAFPEAWVEPARTFRKTLQASDRAKIGLRYGVHPRCVFDLFLPENSEPKGLVVFVHGGYWMSLDNSYWSHFARGPIGLGYAVAMPSYPLCPEVRIADITIAIGEAVRAAAKRVGGPIFLTGHSAGGHLVARMIAENSPLPEEIRLRIRNTLSIAGVHDLRPLLKTEMNETFRLNVAEADAESPVLLRPAEGARLCCWVGAGDRSEFVRQNRLLSNIWQGLGAVTSDYSEPDRNHFNVLDALLDCYHPLTRTLLLEAGI